MVCKATHITYQWCEGTCIQQGQTASRAELLYSCGWHVASSLNRWDLICERFEALKTYKVFQYKALWEGADLSLL